MATTTIAGFVEQCVRFPLAIREATLKATEETCKLAKGDVLGSYRTGFPTMRLSHMGRRSGGTPIDAAYHVRKEHEEVVGIVVARRGAAYLIDDGTYKQPTGYDNRRGAKRRNRANVKAGGLIGPGRHPPMPNIKGGGYFARGRAEAAAKAPTIYAGALAQAMAKNFR